MQPRTYTYLNSTCHTYLIGPHATHEQHQGLRAVCGVQGGVLTRERPARLCKRCAARRAAWERLKGGRG